MHNITIVNTDANWLLWGQLVLQWINGGPPARTIAPTYPAGPPATVAHLQAQMAHALPNPVLGNVQGAPGKPVNVISYPPGAIIIPIPTPGMIAADVATLTAIGTGPYPLPSFYSDIFSTAPQKIYTLPQLKHMALRRLGEYVINECM
jgi:hypothetical protein